MDQPGNHIALRGNQAGAADRMRELLARTVQDHFADQRSSAGALEDIRQRMEGLEWLVKEVREREMPGLASRLLDGPAGHPDQAAQQPRGWAETLAEHIEVLRSQVMPLAEQRSLWADVGTVAENVEQALPQLQAVCDTVGQTLDALRAQDERVARLQQSVGKLQQSMEAAGRFSRLDKAMTELTQRTAHLDKEMSAVKGRAEVGFGALSARLDQQAEATSAQVGDATEKMTAAPRGGPETVTVLGGQVDVLGGQVQVVHGRIERLDERLDERLADTDDKLGALDAKLTAADAKLTAADAMASLADARVAALDTKLERLDERLDDQYDRVSEIDKGLVSMDGKLGAMAGKLGPVDSKLGAMDSRLGTVEGKVGALGGRLDGMDGRMAGVGDQVTALAGRMEGVGERVTALGGRLDSVDERLAGQEERLAGQFEPLADALRSRPNQAGGPDAVAKAVAGSPSEVTARIGSLEETVLTLAEALLRPQSGPREGTRDGTRI